MNNRLDIGDLLIALSKKQEFDEIFYRVFLYIFSKILELNYKENSEIDLDISSTLLTKSEAAKDIGVPIEAYIRATEIILERCLLCREILDTKQEYWSIERNSNKWILNTLLN